MGEGQTAVPFTVTPVPVPTIHNYISAPYIRNEETQINGLSQLV